jgi:formylglycine-generating enzyme required for sulfatase activity
MDAGGRALRPQGASWAGAVDMAGNVWEWMSTRYDDVEYSGQLFNYQGLYPYPYVAEDGRETDETAAEFEARLPVFTLRVLRGGAFENSDSNLRGPIRDGDNPTVLSNLNGFRCARSLE